MERVIEPLSLEESQIDQASRVLARAFYDDPMTLWVFPDESRRAEVLPGFFRIPVVHWRVFGQVQATAALAGFAIWQPPDARPSPPSSGLLPPIRRSCRLWNRSA
ncbi:MAG: hypothetical protein ACR2PL_10555 [Dehalococcoidia bacterium]